jgi:hypothetical protein
VGVAVIAAGTLAIVDSAENAVLIARGL